MPGDWEEHSDEGGERDELQVSRDSEDTASVNLICVPCRLTEEGAEGLGAKFKKYKTEIESYKELRGKIKRGVFTVADLKSAVAEVAQKVATEERHTTTAGPGGMDETAKKEKEQVVMVLVADTEKAQEAKEESQQLSKEAVEVISGTIAVGERVKAATNIRTEGTFPAYKSPLEHMEYLE